MQIRLNYGGFTHAFSDAAVSIRRVGEFNDVGVAYANRETWSILGRLQADSQNELTQLILDLEAVYNQQNRLFIRLEFGPNAPTAHAINRNNTLDGIRVTLAPSYPSGFGAEYANFRNYELQVEALVLTGQFGGNLLVWEEMVSTSGGIPREILVETFNTPPVRQKVAEFTTFYVNQTGRAVAFNSWPADPLFLFPGAVILRNSIQRRSPKAYVIDSTIRHYIYETGWDYLMALDGQVPVLPNIRPLSVPVL